METVNLFSDTQTRPTPAMRRGDRGGRGRRRAALRRPDGERASGARRGAARKGSRPLPPVGHDVQRDRLQAPPAPGRRRGDPRPHRRIPCATRPAARRRSPARCCTRSTARAASSRPTRSPPRFDRPATATGRARGSCRSSRRPTSAAGASGRCAAIDAVLDVAGAHGLRAHLDGARLMNAVVASGVSAADYARASTRPGSTSRRASARRWARRSPASRELIDEAWRYKQMIGGAMRQAGIVAAGALLRARPPRRAARRGP